MSTNKALLKKLEDTLLCELSNATGNILDNQELIATLESAKEKAVDISTKLAAAKVTAKDIEEARVRYSPVATRGAVLFFVMAGLSAVNNMYEYSLAAFLKVFKQVSAVFGVKCPCTALSATGLASTPAIRDFQGFTSVGTGL
jgi:dynein heavy chain